MTARYNVTVEATITVTVEADDTDDGEKDAENKAMELLDSLASDTVRMGDMTCIETALAATSPEP